MYIENISNLSVPQLMDLLVINTEELLELLKPKTRDGSKLLNKKTDVQLIQSQIGKMKAVIQVTALLL